MTDADTSLLALSLGLEALSDFLHNQDPDPPVQGTVVILTSAAAAIGRALDATPHDGQTTSIQCIRSIEDTLRAHPNLNIRLGWLPKAAPFVGCKSARQLALEAVRTAALDEASANLQFSFRLSGAFRYFLLVRQVNKTGQVIKY